MAIVREFVFERTPSEGFCPVGMEGGTPGNGRTVAHDVLEHFSFEGDPIENELQALGALFLLRYESGAQVVDLSIPLHVLLSRNVGDVFNDLLEDDSLELPRRRRVHGRDSLPCDAVEKAVARACEVLRTTEAPFHLDAARVDAIVQAQAAFCDWLLVGYQRAVSRYACSDVYSVGSDLFGEVARSTQSLLQSDMLSDGDRVRVSVDLAGFSVAVRVLRGRRWVLSDEL